MIFRSPRADVSGKHRDSKGRAWSATKFTTGETRRIGKKRRGEERRGKERKGSTEKEPQEVSGNQASPGGEPGWKEKGVCEESPVLRAGRR